MLARDAETPPKHTPLHGLHAGRGGRMVPFAGYAMPVQYAAGVLREHLHTRKAAGLFDVSHMGQIALRPKSGRIEHAALALERMVPQDIVAIAPGRQRYAQFTTGSGGILDDLMVANFGSHLFLVVNAACKAADEAHLRAACPMPARSNRSPTRADRAAGTQGRIGAGEVLCRRAGDAVHGFGSPPRRRHRLFRLALRLHRRGRL